jgi:hypothetical protein
MDLYGKAHRPRADTQGWAEARLENPSLEGGIALSVRFRPEELPQFVQCTMTGEGTYVVGLEPATCRVPPPRPVHELRVYLLQGAALGLRHHAVNEQDADDAEEAVEPEHARGCDGVDQGQHRRGDDQVQDPMRKAARAGSLAAHLQGVHLRVQQPDAQPQAGREGGDVDRHRRRRGPYGHPRAKRATTRVPVPVASAAAREAVEPCAFPHSRRSGWGYLLWTQGVGSSMLGPTRSRAGDHGRGLWGTEVMGCGRTSVESGTTSDTLAGLWLAGGEHFVSAAAAEGMDLLRDRAGRGGG